MALEEKHEQKLDLVTLLGDCIKIARRYLLLCIVLVSIGGGFFVNCGYVALGEIIALALGVPLYWAVKKVLPKLNKFG